MKGAALSVNPELRFVDVSHSIAPQGILEGALILRSVFDVFPEGTIFVAVIDPGVGGPRRILAGDLDGRIALAPDNGLLSPLLDARRSVALHAVTAARFFRAPVHPTFHGRDLFAPVAARIALGTPLSELGPAIDDPVRLRIPEPRALAGGLLGEVLHVDRFGNLVTNFRETDLAALSGGAAIEIAGRIARRAATYSDAGTSRDAELAPIAVTGSWGYLEVALPGRDAARLLGAGVGTPVRARSAGGAA